MDTFHEENGFTLIESIIAVTLVSLTITGLFLAWYFVESRDRRLENYWQYKETVELAYQVTHQSIRDKAGLPITLINSGQGISFTGTDNKSWTFTKEGNNYKLVHDTKEEILIANICNNANFIVTGNMVAINIGVTTPPDWTGANDLNINGEVLIRNP